MHACMHAHVWQQGAVYTDLGASEHAATRTLQIVCRLASALEAHMSLVDEDASPPQEQIRLAHADAHVLDCFSYIKR